MRLLAIGPRFLGIRWGVVLGRRDLEKVFAPRNKVPFDPDTSSFLYVLKGEHGRVKIGISADPYGRLAQLQTGSAHKLEFAWIGAPQGQAMGIEHDAHVMLNKYQCNGEWFDITPDAAVGAVSAAAQRRGINILGCTPELVEQIRQVIATQDATATKPRIKRSHKIALWVVGIVGVIELLLIYAGSH